RRDGRGRESERQCNTAARRGGRREPDRRLTGSSKTGKAKITARESPCTRLRHVSGPLEHAPFRIPLHNKPGAGGHGLDTSVDSPVRGAAGYGVQTIVAAQGHGWPDDAAGLRVP